MQLIVHGRNVEVTEWVEEYVQKKIGKLERFLPQAREARAELTHSPTRAAEDRYTAQITIWANGQILRAEESTSDIFASIDATADKLYRQITRFKGRRVEGRRRQSAAASLEAEMSPTPAEIEAATETEGEIVRRKKFTVEMMGEAEAIEQMELLGHDFYLFLNADEGSINLIYRRRDGNYGLLQPIVA
jgi:putative sigma-54 modulation protein